MQKDLERQESWAINNHIQFNKSKCQILHLGRGNPVSVYRLGDKSLENSPTERNLEALVNDILNMSQQYGLVKEANHALGYIRHNPATMLREEIVLLYSALVQPHLEFWVQFWVPQCKKDVKGGQLK